MFSHQTPWGSLHDIQGREMGVNIFWSCIWTFERHTKFPRYLISIWFSSRLSKFTCPSLLYQIKSARLTLFKDNFLCQFYFPGLFSLLHIHTWWGQSKYVRKFEISQANFEKTQNLFILKNFLGILCNNIQNCSISKELRHKSFENLQTISKLVQECLN